MGDAGVAAVVVGDLSKPYPDHLIVDGAPFGWHISEDGPQAFQLASPGVLDGRTAATAGQHRHQDGS